jgi:hypothetical protein
MNGMDLIVAAVSLPLKIVAMVVVFGPIIIFVRFLVRAAKEDGEIQKERDKGGSKEG